ncbi:thiopurine S-methyltransferase [Brachionus plicatilis]|uniref:thiopurine S-methyltransferase n=1 Tax=Brachionus plicatilis TaxID=10195 RepID=A0A3M7RTT4_BRAPC|nr:thiopurine S-methyltransferase [Brachionus plicatilis]
MSQGLEPTITKLEQWTDKWQNNQIAFHQMSNHPFLVNNLKKLTTTSDEKIRILFPLCGKAVDMAWQSENGQIKIYNGDFFKFSIDLEKPFECVWDRGAYVALFYELRIKYIEHIKKILDKKAKYLMEVFDYDQHLYPGPPFSIPIEEIRQFFGLQFQVEFIESRLFNPFGNLLVKDKHPKMSSSVSKETGIEYWNQSWIKNEIFFHKNENNAYLVKHLNRMIGNKQKSRIFFPLSGKAVDMAWLASLGHEVVGVEFVQMACEQFFSENNIKFTVKDLGDLKLFSSEDGRIKIYNGDFFKFNTKLEKPFECVWDRGAYGALHYDLRAQYAAHIRTLLDRNVHYLLVVFEYDPRTFGGPPHSISQKEIQTFFGDEFKLELIDSQPFESYNKTINPEPGSNNLYLITKNLNLKN